MPGFWVACFGMAALVAWLSLRRMRLFPEQFAIYTHLAPRTKIGALAMNFLALTLDFVLLIRALFNIWEQDPLHGNPAARSGAKYEAQYKGKEFHLLRGLAAFSDNIPNVEMGDPALKTFDWDTGWNTLFLLCPQRPGHGYNFATLYLVLGCFALLYGPCGLIGEWRKYQGGMKLLSASWLFSVAVPWRYARAGVAIGACALESLLPLCFFSEISTMRHFTLTGRGFNCNTNIDAVTSEIEKWAGHDGYVTSDSLNWTLHSVPKGDPVAKVRLEEAWKPSPFDRWTSTWTSFRRISPRLAFELIGTDKPAETRVALTIVGSGRFD